MAAIAAATVSSILGFGLPLLKQATSTYIDADIDLLSLHMGFILSTFQDHSELSDDPSAVTKQWLKYIKNLAYEIEDYIEQFLSRSARQQSNSWVVIAAFRRFQLGRQIGKFSQKSAKARFFFETYKVEPTSTPTTTQKASEEVHAHASMEDSLLQHVHTNAPTGSHKKHKVISIIGYSALGNRLLVNKVYNTELRNQFPRHARVDAEGKYVEDVIDEIQEQLRQIQSAEMGTSSTVQVKGTMKQEGAEQIRQPSQIQSGFRKFKEMWDVKGKGIMKQEVDKRYLTVIDNVNMEDLHSITIALFNKPGNEVGGIIIATTNHTEATHCKCQSPSLDCTETAQYMQMQEMMIEELKDEAYVQETRRRKKELQDVLVSKYNKILSSLHLSVEKKIISDIEQCLLYFCMFPHDHVVRWNLLKMRYLAEGIAFGDLKEQQNDAFCTPLECLKSFIGQHGIQPIQFSKNGQVKKCQLPMMLLNHISSESKSKSFLTLSCDSTGIDGWIKDKDKSLVRRLSLHRDQNGQLILPNAHKLRRLRTLVVFHSGDIANISELFKYKLLRVLDLKEWVRSGPNSNEIVLTKEEVEKICDLLLLRYLSLGDSISKVPRDIGKLVLLETLVMRKTRTVYVPVELMQLPQLKHLLGKFQFFKGHITDKKLDEIKTSKQKNKLESLSGFVIGEDSKAFAELMSLMEQLRKVKIWCTAGRWTPHVTAAIKRYTGKHLPETRSLSIECDVYTSEILKCLELPGTLTSLKLSGDLKTNLSGVLVDRPIIGLMGIQVLCLSGTNLSGFQIVDLLKHFKALKHMKLVEKNLRVLVIPYGYFYTLKSLCLVAVDNLRSIKIEHGALSRLVTLHMLFTPPCDLHGIDITKLSCLEEIGLHSGVAPDIKEDWQKKASEYEKKPRVVFIQSLEIEKKASDSSAEQSPASQSVVG